MKIPVVLAVVALTVSPLAASGWLPFTQTPRIGPAEFDQAEAVVASNGIDYRAAWTTNAPGISFMSTAEIDHQGKTTTTLPQPLDANARGISLSAARDGYFAAWISGSGLNAAVVDSFGHVENRATLAQPGLNTTGWTRTAWSGGVHLVLSGVDGPFTAALFDDDGDLLQSGIVVGDMHRDSTALIAMTADANGFLVVSTKQNAAGHEELYARRISPSGVLSDWFLVRTTVTQVLGLAVTSDGMRDVIAWGDEFGVWTMTVGGSSRQLTPDAARVTDILLAGGRTWIAYQNLSDSNSFAISIDEQGTTSAPAALPGTSRLASNGSTILSASLVRGPMDMDVEGVFLGDNGASAPFLISMSETAQNHGQLDSDGKTTIAVWDEAIGASHQIFAARFTSSALDPTGIPISSSGDNTDPDVAFNGNEALIVWTRGTDVVARRFSSDGTILDSEDIVLSEGESRRARVVWDGVQWFVVWTEEVQQAACANFGAATRVYAAHVSRAGVVLEPGGIQLDANPTMDQDNPRVAWNGSEYVVAWTNICAHWHGPTVTQIAMAVASRDLTSVRVGVISTSGSDPKIAARGERSLVAWTANGGTEFRVVDNTLEQSTARRRAFLAEPRSFPTIAGTLIAVEPQGILTQTAIPTAPLYQGLYETAVDDSGNPGVPHLLFVLEPTETLMGRLVIQNGERWMAESMLNSLFDPAAGATRLWIRGF